MSECRFGCDCPFLEFNTTMKNAPILVRNPYTNDLINVQPFFDLLHKHYNDDPRKYAKKIDEEIRLLVEFMPSDEETLIPIKNTIDQMFDRRNAEFEILVPEEVQNKIDSMIIEIKGPE